jgi:hypothetical protein
MSFQAYAAILSQPHLELLEAEFQSGGVSAQQAVNDHQRFVNDVHGYENLPDVLPDLMESPDAMGAIVDRWEDDPEILGKLETAFSDPATRDRRVQEFKDDPSTFLSQEVDHLDPAGSTSPDSPQMAGLGQIGGFMGGMIDYLGVPEGAFSMDFAMECMEAVSGMFSNILQALANTDLPFDMGDLDIEGTQQKLANEMDDFKQNAPGQLREVKQDMGLDMA